MGRNSKYSKVFYNKNYERPEEVELYLVCGNCKFLHVLPSLELDYTCECGNKMVEHVNKDNIKECHIRSEELN